LSDSYRDYIVGVHSLYEKYEEDWQLARDSFYGGVEIRDGKYLKAYAVDMNTPAETVNTYTTDSNGYVKTLRARVENVSTKSEAHRGENTVDDGTFYAEKLRNTPYFNYLRLISAEYNSILFKNPPQRYLGDRQDITDFIMNVNGEEDNINEFMAQVDLYTFIYGTVWISCVKPIGSDIPKWKIHTPLDVTNWHYGYDGRGELTLKSLVIKLHESAEETVYRVMTPETIDTVWIAEDNEDYVPDVDNNDLIKEDGYYRVSEINELGYIPVVPVYQGMKIYNGIGATPSFDLAQIQRSVYADMAEIYSVISYGAHGTLIVDEGTDSLNDGAIGAEPGSIVRVPVGIGEASNYVYEFVTPPLTAVTEIRELIDQKITKMAEISMIRSDELIKASRSGEQLEQYDSKLEAFVRRKAQNLENLEAKLFNIYFDWTNQNKPEDFSISYNRQYSKKALQHEVAEIDSLLKTYTDYQNVFQKDYTIQDYATEAEAISVAQSLGGDGFHSHTREDGLVTYMPFKTHLEFEQAVEATKEADENGGFVEEMRDKIRNRLMQLVDSSTTDNGV